LTFVSRKSFLCERINFSNDHSPSLFYYPRGKTTPPGSIPGLSKDISRVQHHRDDVQEHLLLVLYSDVTLQSPEINFGPEPHAFLRLRKRSLETNTSRSETKKVKLLMTPPKEEPSSQQIYDLAISSKIIFSQKTTPKFTSLFPGTSWPHITHVLGLPRIETSLFNTLLTSLIRTTKTMLKSSRFKCPEQLPAEYTLALSRMISRSLEIEFKTARQRCVRQDSKTPKGKPRAIGDGGKPLEPPAKRPIRVIGSGATPGPWRRADSAPPGAGGNSWATRQRIVLSLWFGAVLSHPAKGNLRPLAWGHPEPPARGKPRATGKGVPRAPGREESPEPPGNGLLLASGEGVPGATRQGDS
jgi:hypothetical protein